MGNTDSADAPLVACPHCNKPVRWVTEERFRPFCSERCKLIDLGAWASESHRIPGEANTTQASDHED